MPHGSGHLNRAGIILVRLVLMICACGELFSQILCWANQLVSLEEAKEKMREAGGGGGD